MEDTGIGALILAALPGILSILVAALVVALTSTTPAGAS